MGVEFDVAQGFAQANTALADLGVELDDAAGGLVDLGGDLRESRSEPCAEVCRGGVALDGSEVFAGFVGVLLKVVALGDGLVAGAGEVLELLPKFECRAESSG